MSSVGSDLRPNRLQGSLQQYFAHETQCLRRRGVSVPVTHHPRPSVAAQGRSVTAVGWDRRFGYTPPAPSRPGGPDDLACPDGCPPRHPQPRGRNGRHHTIHAVLGLIVVGFLTGRKTLEAISQFCRDYGPKLAHSFGITRFTPARSTISQLDTAAVEAALARWGPVSSDNRMSRRPFAVTPPPAARRTPTRRRRCSSGAPRPGWRRRGAPGQCGRRASAAGRRSSRPTHGPCGRTRR